MSKMNVKWMKWMWNECATNVKRMNENKNAELITVELQNTKRIHEM